VLLSDNGRMCEDDAEAALVFVFVCLRAALGGVWSYYTVRQIKGISFAGHFAFEVGRERVQ